MSIFLLSLFLSLSLSLSPSPSPSPSSLPLSLCTSLIELSPSREHGACAIDNGGCDYLCLATGETSRVCACPDNLPDCSDSHIGKNNCISSRNLTQKCLSTIIIIIIMHSRGYVWMVGSTEIFPVLRSISSP